MTEESEGQRDQVWVLPRRPCLRSEHGLADGEGSEAGPRRRGRHALPDDAPLLTQDPTPVDGVLSAALASDPNIASRLQCRSGVFLSSSSG